MSENNPPVSVGEHRRVVDEDVDPTELRRGRWPPSTPSTRVGDVDPPEHRATAVGLDALRCLLTFRFEQVGHQHRRARLREPLGVGAADATGTPGDDRELALELSGHVVLPL